MGKTDYWKKQKSTHTTTSLNKLLQLYNKQRCNRRREEVYALFLRKKLLPFLEEHVNGPFRRGKIAFTWTNNNCESANHVLKTAIQLKMQDLPKCIDTLYKIVSKKNGIAQFVTLVTSDLVTDSNIITAE